MDSSSAEATSWKYDVFLNFRGTDTRNNFTSHLHHALCNEGIRTFIDDELERGKVISPALLEVIETSRMSILVFSQDYASSTYCLDELVKILECLESERQIVVPIFYNVSPEEVEKQSGRYGEAFTRHESMEDMEKVKVWKAALTTAASISGFPLNNGNEAYFIQRIIEELRIKLNKKFLHVADYSVGLDSHMEDMNHLLNIGSNDVCMVGICGTGGIGKTTIAKAIFNRFANQFEGSCFLASVREMLKKCSVAQLQETLLFEILGDKKPLMGNSDQGVILLKGRLCNKRVFIIIDDVDDIDQLKKLAGELQWFGSGSRIIFTTRDEHLLVSHGVQKLHKVKGLCYEDALRLFCWNAFKKPEPDEHYAKLSHCVLKYVNGLPLGLVVLGSHLHGRDIPQWESCLDQWKRNPNKKIYDILKISFDGLEDNEKAIFLDIACFFKGRFEDDVSRILNACGFKPASGIPILTEKSLISIEHRKIQMHDLIQSMGWQVVHEESPNFPGKRSRLWHHEDVRDVLTEEMGTHNIEAIMLDLAEEEEVYLPAEAFAKMKGLKKLIIRNAQITGGPRTLPNDLRWLEWPGCPLESLPSKFRARKLVALNMPKSFIKHFGVDFEHFRNLKCMDFRNCKFLTEIPDLSTMSCLESLDFKGCSSLVKIHPSIGFLEKLNILTFAGCFNLESLPSCFELRSLGELCLSGCTKLEELPNFKNLGNLERLSCSGCILLKETPDLSTAAGLEALDFGGCRSLVRIHPSIGFLEKLETLSFERCSNLKHLPSCFKLTSLKQLNLSLTPMRKLPNGMENMTRLRGLHLESMTIKELPSSIGFLYGLRSLSLSNSKNLTSLPSGIYKLDGLRELRLDNCSQLSKFPDNKRKSTSWSSDATTVATICYPSQYVLLRWLRYLNLEGSNLASIPSCICKFVNLEELYLSGCPQLGEIPKLPRRIQVVEARDCKSLERFSQLKHIFQFNNTEESLDIVTVLDFSNCHKLTDNQGKNFEIYPYHDRMPSLKAIDVVLPGSEIPPCFRYNGEGDSLSFQLPSSLLVGKVKAFLFCIIVASDAAEKWDVSYEVSINGIKVESFPVSRNMFYTRRQKLGRTFNATKSDHIWFSNYSIEMSADEPWLNGFDFTGVPLEMLNDSYFAQVSLNIQYDAATTKVKRCGADLLLFEEEYSYLPEDRLSSTDPLGVQEWEGMRDEGWESNGDIQSKRMRLSDLTDQDELFTDENDVEM